MVTELLKPVEEQNEPRLKVITKMVYKAKPTDLVDTNLVDCEQTESKLPQSNTDAKNKLKDMLGVEVNDETTGMIDDIVASFESVLTGNNNNPMAGIMEISQKISVKYADKINNGEIELDKLMKSITQKVPGMESMLGGMMGGMMGEKSEGKKKSKDKIMIDETFSTANIKVGMNKEEDKKSFNIGNVLKMADQFGVIPGGKQSDSSGMPDLSAFAGMAGMAGIPGMSEIPNLEKVMEMMQKLEKTETKEEAEALKLEMDSFLQKELGVDVEKLNQQLENVTNATNATNATNTQTETNTQNESL